MVPLDKRHTIRVNKMTDIDRYGREGRVDEEYTAPKIEPFQEKEHLRSFLADPSGRGRDQFAMFRGDNVGVFWNNEKDTPENIVDRQHWTESFVQWSPLGTYLVSVHQQGVQLWGGQSWSRQRRFAHPFVNMLDFSPSERYVVTWSNRPISIPDEGHPQLSMDEDGKNYVIWDLETSKPLRSFANLDIPSSNDPNAPPKPAPKFPWPAFKWSSDDRYVARLNQGQSISVYELPRMNLLDKMAIKLEGVMDFEWAPATPQRDGVKLYEQLFCFWTPEIGSSPARVGLMSMPSKQVVRSLNLFSVSDAKLHWQSDAAYLAVKVDRHSKSKKSQATTLEIFRVKEKGVPVEVVDTIKDTVINFAWEPKGDRFVVITTTEPIGPTAVPPKTSVAFFCPEKAKGSVIGNFRHLRTLEKKNSNSIYWSPKGRFVVVATIANQQSSDLDFFDLDFEGEKPESDKDLTANLQLMNVADHYGVTDLQWDPSGRFVASWASVWKHTVSLALSPLFVLLGPLPIISNMRTRWKTATISTTSGASSCARSPSTSSSSGSGDHDLPRYSLRTSRSRSARTCASTRGSSSRRTPSAVRRPTWPSSKPGDAFSTSGTRGAPRSKKSSRRRGSFAVSPRNPSRRNRPPRRTRARSRSSRRSSRRCSRSTRRSSRDRLAHPISLLVAAVWGTAGDGVYMCIGRLASRVC